MGESFTSATSVANKKQAIINACEKWLTGPLKKLAEATPAFNCAHNITFHVVDTLIQPLTQKAI